MPPFPRRRLRLALALALGLGGCPPSLAKENSADSEGCAEGAEALDWAVGAPASGDARAARCGGHYLDPLGDEDTSVDLRAAPIQAEAQHSELREESLSLKGEVIIRQAYRRVAADAGEYERASGQGRLRGNVSLREPGLLLRGVSGEFDLNTGEASMRESRFALHGEHIHGGAELARRRADEILELEAARYSYCPPQPGHREQWALAAKSIELDLAEGVGTARSAKIEVGGIPVLYTPYIQFPLGEGRRTGLLWPQIGGDSSGGLDIAAPWYFNLAPNYDATLTPRYIGDRGLLAEAEGRYLGRPAGYWELGGAWLGGDKQYQNDYPGADGDRWLLGLQQRGLLGRRWRSRIDFTDVSDGDYFSDLGTTSLQITQSTHLAQRGELDYLGDDWRLSLRLEDFKTIARDIRQTPYRKLPQIALRRATPARPFRPNLLYAGDYAHFDHHSRLTGQRLYNNIGLSWPMKWVWGFLNPTARYRQIHYELDEPVLHRGRMRDDPQVGAPLFSLDGGLFFERDTAWGLQTLEPRLFYLRAERKDHEGLPNFDSPALTFTYNQLFRETRFSGRDRLDDANQLSLGLTTRMLDPASGRESFALSLGQILYFDDREVNPGQPRPEDSDNRSALAAQFSLNRGRAFRLQSSLLWDTQEEHLGQGHFQLGHQGQNGRVFNLGYNFRRRAETADIDQAYLSAWLPVNRRWSLFLSSLYDLEKDDRINDLAGIEYNSCCWRLRLVYQRHLDQAGGAFPAGAEHERAAFLEFQLKGLGGIGHRLRGMLEEAIPGFRGDDS